MPAEPVLAVLLFSSLAALLAALGVVPFAAGRQPSPVWIAGAYALASGLMLGAGHLLMSRGLERGAFAVVAGSDRRPETANQEGLGYKLLLESMLHATAEGVAIGVAMVLEIKLGVFVALALAVHNIGEAMALTDALRRRGVSIGAAAGLCVGTNVPQPLLALAVFALEPVLGALLPAALGFAAGALVFLVLTELLPASYERAGGHRYRRHGAAARGLLRMTDLLSAETGLVFLYGLITAVATGLGALPFLFMRRVSARNLALANALASGLMLGACSGLLLEGARYGIRQTVTGGALGVAFILVGERLLAGRQIEFGALKGAGAKKILLILAVMTLHSFSEGVAVGVAFGGGAKLAALITIAIAVHNVPEGLAISAVMRSRGSSIAACAGWSVFSSLPQPLMAVPAFLFVEAFRPLLPYGLGFAAGAMIFMVFLELLPEAYENASATAVGLWVSASMGAMILFQRYL
jgi:zinc transporter ZupT